MITPCFSQTSHSSLRDRGHFHFHAPQTKRGENPNSNSNDLIPAVVVTCLHPLHPRFHSDSLMAGSREDVSHICWSSLLSLRWVNRVCSALSVVNRAEPPPNTPLCKYHTWLYSNTSHSNINASGPAIKTGQAPKVIQSYTSPAGGAVSAAGLPFPHHNH